MSAWFIGGALMFAFVLGVVLAALVRSGELRSCRESVSYYKDLYMIWRDEMQKRYEEASDRAETLRHEIALKRYRVVDVPPVPERLIPAKPGRIELVQEPK